MTKHLTLLLFIGLAWGQDLHFISADGKTVTIKKANFRALGPYDFFYVNGTRCLLKNVNHRTKMVKIASNQKLKFSPQYKEIPFDSISSFRYMKRRFSIIPMLIGGGIGYYNLYKPKADTLSFVFGTIPAFSLGLALSFVPKYSKELIVGDGEWSIEVK
tara:strand:+ start:417 stop:893 length:477 start_codon:yes stop_codon:yes gene_type:complete